MPPPRFFIRRTLRAAALAAMCTVPVAAAVQAATLRGDDGRNVVRGTAGADRLFGGGGKDRLLGGRGRDVLRGGSGRDVLTGGPGRDILRGGRGNDRIMAADGARDRISCGRGRDRAVLDRKDTIVRGGSCEIVTGRSAKRMPDAYLVAAGDIAACTQGAEITAALVDELPGTVAPLGDTAYENGTPQEFAQCYAPTWGRHKSRTRPAIGNHEYGTPGATGYFDYFGAAAGERGRGWYSYDLGAWHLIALNSNCSEVGGCGPQSEQGRWLRADLASSEARCTLAYMHHPRFSSGNAHGGSPTVEPLWKALADAGAEMVLSGHDHDYERFAPQTPAGALDVQRGVRQFVVGTGGKSLRSFGTASPNSQARINTAFGVLHLRLRDGSYGWRFVAQPGSPATDSGTETCH